MTDRRDPLDRVVDMVVAVPVSMTVAISRAVPAAWRAAQRRALPVVDAFAEGTAAVAEVATEAAEAVEQVVDDVAPDPADVDDSDLELVSEVAPDDALAEPDVGLSADELPIEDYDALAARQVVARLADLFPEELDAVERYEIAHRHRQTVLHRIAQLRA